MSALHLSHRLSLASILTLIALSAPQAARADADADAAKLQKLQEQLDADTAAARNNPNAVTKAQLDAESAAVAAARTQLFADIPALAPTPSSNCAFQGGNPQDYCVVTGAFTVPFKLELTHNKDVFGSASLNGFAGINLSKWFRGANVTAIGFAGYSANLNSSNTNNPATQSSTTASTGAISYGLGFVVPIGGTYQAPTRDKPNVAQVHVGAVVGFDHTTSVTKYIYNDKPWISVLIGTSF